MKLVRRHQREMAPQVVRLLSVQEQEALRSNDEREDVQQAILKSLYGHWITCHCDVPFTIKRRKESDHYYIARLSEERGLHCEHCPLHKITKTQQHKKTHCRVKPSTSFTFDVLPSASTGTTKKAKDGAVVVTRTDPLHALAASLLSASLVNQVTFNAKPQYGELKARIQSAAKSFSLGGKPLSEYLYFGMGSLSKIKQELQERSVKWVGRHQPQAICIAHVESVNQKGDEWNIRVRDDWEMTLPAHVKVTKRTSSSDLKKGPVMLWLVITKISDEEGYGIKRVYCGPALSQGSFVMFDSDFERTVMRIAISSVLKDRGAVRLVYPHFEHTNAEMSVKPTLLFDTGYEQIAVSVTRDKTVSGGENTLLNEVYTHNRQFVWNVDDADNSYHQLSNVFAGLGGNITNND